MKRHTTILFAILCQLAGKFPDDLLRQIRDLQDEGAIIGRYPLDTTIPVERCEAWQIEAYVPVDNTDMYHKVLDLLQLFGLEVVLEHDTCPEAFIHTLDRERHLRQEIRVI